jgi:hypothetical protein
VPRGYHHVRRTVRPSDSACHYEKVLAPAFKASTGFGCSGFGAASGDLESDIAAGEIHPNVFQSVGGDNITPLQPKSPRA